MDFTIRICSVESKQTCHACINFNVVDKNVLAVSSQSYRRTFYGERLLTLRSATRLEDHP
jgi:hypothetical protein